MHGKMQGKHASARCKGNMQEHAEQVWEQGPCSTNDRDKGDGADGDEWYYRNAGLGQEGLNAPAGSSSLSYRAIDVMWATLASWTSGGRMIWSPRDPA